MVKLSVKEIFANVGASSSSLIEGKMETIKILEKPADITWDYDEEADVLYLSIGRPKSGEGIDIGEGVILRYDDNRKEVVGLTLIGLRARLLRSLIPNSPTSSPPTNKIDNSTA